MCDRSSTLSLSVRYDKVCVLRLDINQAVLSVKTQHRFLCFRQTLAGRWIPSRRAILLETEYAKNGALSEEKAPFLHFYFPYADENRHSVTSR